jgi:hypothetical protein
MGTKENMVIKLNKILDFSILKSITSGLHGTKISICPKKRLDKSF